MFTVTRYDVGSVPQLICGESSNTRDVLVLNDGPVPVWVGAAGVIVGRGRVVWPGEKYRYSERDELYVVANGAPEGSVSVDERRAS